MTLNLATVGIYVALLNAMSAGCRRTPITKFSHTKVMKEPAGIIRCPVSTNKRFHDLTGRTFERLTVLEYAGKRVRASGVAMHYWKCACSCGENMFATSSNLTRNHTRSCGCLLIETSSRIGMEHSQRTHGMTNTPEHKAWSAMHSRCSNPSSNSWLNYGGRGIKVCERWTGRTGFANFYSDIGPRPSPKHSIDRINNDGNYEPGNVRWATKREQDENRRGLRKIPYKGEMLCCAEVSRRLGFQHNLVNRRLSKGWSELRAVSEAFHKEKSGKK